MYNSGVLKKGIFMDEVKSKIIKRGIKSHIVETDLFKTNVISIYFTVPLTKKDVTKNSLLTLLIKNGGKKYPTQYDVSRKLDKMYGAYLSFGVAKRGDNQVIKFYIDTINNNYTFEKEDLLEEAFDLLLDIIFNPNVNEEGYFEESLIKIEKNNLKNVLESAKDDKDSYAFDRCLSEMYAHDGFGLNQYGIIEDVDSITKEDLKSAYEKLLNEAKIDIFISGNVNENKVDEMIDNSVAIKNLCEREGIFISYDQEKDLTSDTQKIEEKLAIVQGKLVIGIDACNYVPNYRSIGLVFNAILGDGPNSMMFQNVREKAGLAYSARSNFVYQKMNIFIRLGIMSKNYEKALNLSLKQLENIKEGNFSDEDLENAKIYLSSGIRSLKEDQEAILLFYYGRELSNDKITLDEYEESIKRVTKEDILEFAKGISINTIYYLNAIEELGEE